MAIHHITGDILTMNVDCIVNPANPALAPGGGLSGKIHAKYPEVFVQAQAQYPLGLHTGEATGPFATNGQAPAKHVIFTVGPKNISRSRDVLLNAAYNSVFWSATGTNIRTIAFPLISTGIYGVAENLSEFIFDTLANAWVSKFETIFLVKFK